MLSLNVWWGWGDFILPQFNMPEFVDFPSGPLPVGRNGWSWAAWKPGWGEVGVRWENCEWNVK